MIITFPAATYLWKVWKGLCLHFQIITIAHLHSDIATCGFSSKSRVNIEVYSIVFMYKKTLEWFKACFLVFCKAKRCMFSHKPNPATYVEYVSAASCSIHTLYKHVCSSQHLCNVHRNECYMQPGRRLQYIVCCWSERHEESPETLEPPYHRTV